MHRHCYNQHNLEDLHILVAHQHHLQLHRMYPHGVEHHQHKPVISGNNKTRIINPLLSMVNHNNLELAQTLHQTANLELQLQTQGVAFYLGKLEYPELLLIKCVKVVTLYHNKLTTLFSL